MCRIVEVFGPPSAGKTFLATARWSPLKNKMVWRYSSIMKTVWRWPGCSQWPERRWGWRSVVYKQPDTFEDSVELIGTILKWYVMKSLSLNQHLSVSWLTHCVYGSELQSREVRKDGWRHSKDKDQLNMNDNTALARATSRTSLLWLCGHANTTPASSSWSGSHKNRCNVWRPYYVARWNSPKFYASVRIRLGASVMKDVKRRSART